MRKKKAKTTVAALGPGRHAMADGLLLQVTQSGGRSWIFRFQRHGRRHDMGLGAFPAITLAGARELARRQRALLALGRDPLAERRAAAAALRQHGAPRITFATLVEDHIVQHSRAWRGPKTAAEWRASLRTHATSLSDLEPVAITTDHVLSVLSPMWAEHTVTANRVRQRIEAILDAAKARGLMTGDNPARWRGNLAHLLPNPGRLHQVTHHKALPWAELPALMGKLAGQGARPAALALRFIVLTAARASEATWAVWDELDFGAGVWTIPPSRMKSGREHRVPLSAAAVLVLRQARALAPGRLVLAGASPGRPVSLVTLGKVMGATTGLDVTVHGLRSSFRDWAAETGVPDAVAEACLAHARGNATERAYARTDLLERRREVMDAWAAFAGGQVQRAERAAAMSPSRKSKSVGKSKAVEQVNGKVGSRARLDASGKTRRQVLADVHRRFEQHMRCVLEHENLLASRTKENPYGGLTLTQLERFARQPVHPLVRSLFDELKVWERPAALKGIVRAVENWGRPSERPYSPKKAAILKEMYELRRQGKGAKKAALVVAAQRVGAAGANTANVADPAAAIHRLWLRRNRTAFSD